MPQFCVAYGCSNSSAKDSCRSLHISFHRFPLADKILLKQWLHNMKRENFEPTSNSRLCSDHFEKDCFEYQNYTNKKLLEKNSVPTLFSFIEQKNKRKRTSYSFGNEESSVENEESNVETATTSATTQTDVGFTDLIDELAVKNNIIHQLKEEVGHSFSPEHMTDEEIKSFSGFNKQTFFKIYNFSNLEDDLSSERLCRLSPLKQYFIFMIRLRKGFTLDILAYIFKVSKGTVSRIFNHLTSVIYDKIKGISIWPDRHQVSEYTSAVFRKKYPNCRIIIDCTEFEVQKPFSPTEQKVAFSNYKNKNAAKALVGIAPSGGICFISDLWCESVSDKALFSQTNLLQLLERGDTVLADKGFTIGNELRNIGCELAQPLLLSDKIQFSFEERAINKSVSHLRVHIERTIARIKTFKYFEGQIPYTSFHNLNEVFYIAAFLTNFTPPLINMYPVHPEQM